ncbi:hypothetical protein ACQ4PT_055273 [Festuca glaucescens]
MMGRPGCPDKCGGMSIPFPFCMDKPGCFLPGFEVTCNTSSTPPRAFLAYNHDDPPYEVIYQYAFGNESRGGEDRYQAVELFDISLDTSEVRVYGGVTSRCFPNETVGLRKGEYMREGPFLLSPRDDLVGVSWSVQSSMSYQIKPYPDPLSCTSNSPFRVTAPNGSCSGLGCCQIALPPPWPNLPVIDTAVILDPDTNTFLGNQSALLWHGGGEVMVQLLDGGLVRLRGAVQEAHQWLPGGARFRHQERLV